MVEYFWWNVWKGDEKNRRKENFVVGFGYFRWEKKKGEILREFWLMGDMVLWCDYVSNDCLSLFCDGGDHIYRKVF